MIPIYVCEDEAAIRRVVVEEIRTCVLIQNMDMAVVCETPDPKELLVACRAAETRGVYFLDVDLKNEAFNGFELAKAIRQSDPRGYIIFVTTHGELSFETFRYRLEAMDYIIKDNMDTVRVRIRECLSSVQERIRQERLDESEFYTIKVFDTIHNIPMRQILYFETSPQKHRIVVHTDTEIVEFFGNLQTIEDAIGANFLRTHRSFLVNKARIHAINLKEDCVELANGETCPLSRKVKKNLRAQGGE